MSNEKLFVKALINYIFSDDDDYVAKETLCRKLFKYDLIDKKDGYWFPKD